MSVPLFGIVIICIILLTGLLATFIVGNTGLVFLMLMSLFTVGVVLGSIGTKDG